MKAHINTIQHKQMSCASTDSRVCHVSVRPSVEAQWTWRCLFFASQPDLLNFKKGWMSKLDESGEVRHSEAESLAQLLLPLLMRKAACKAIVADYPCYHSDSFVASGTTGVSSLSEWYAWATELLTSLITDCRSAVYHGAPLSAWCHRLSLHRGCMI